MASLLGENDEMLKRMNDFRQAWTLESFLEDEKDESINLFDLVVHIPANLDIKPAVVEDVPNVIDALLAEPLTLQDG